MRAFPNPLSAQEEERYVKEYAEGDLQAKRILIEHNLRLVAHVIKKYPARGEDPEDLISIGTIGLIKAVATFNPNMGNRLAAYASRCVENELLMYLRSKKKTSRDISLFEPIGTDREGNDIRLYDILQTEEEDVSDRLFLTENIKKLYEIIESRLSKRERDIIKMRYGLYGEVPRTQREIAGMLGISRSYVSRIEKGIVEKLRRFF